jgi:hypothetical protein
MLGIDSSLDAIAALLAHSTLGVAELSETNVTVFHHGQSDPDEDIKAGCNKCKGVHVLVYDLGGDSDPMNADSPVIDIIAAVELYLDTTKRNRRKTPDLRLAGQIRDDIMRSLHLSPELMDGEHCHMEPRVKGYKPIADPNYVVYRILLQRSIYLT